MVIHDITCAEAGILDKDLAGSNGIVQVVSEVFIPEGVFCPDVIFAAEQRQQARISYYGYDCRKKGTKHLTNQDATKPVGLTVDKKTQQVFWSNDQDYPHGATSWLSLCLMNCYIAFRENIGPQEYVRRLFVPSTSPRLT